MFAELIASHLNAIDRLKQSQATLLGERQTSELREQFISVLGHDMRNPLASVAAGLRMIAKAKSLEDAIGVAGMMQGSVNRMSLLINDVLDFARGRLGGGLRLNWNNKEPLEQMLSQVVAELRSSRSDRKIETHFNLTQPINCASHRLAQLFSNLVGNAITHGAPAAQLSPGPQPKMDVPIIGRERWRPHPSRCYGSTVSGVFSGKCHTIPTRAGSGVIHRLRDCPCAQRHARSKLDRRLDTLHVSNADSVMASA